MSYLSSVKGVTSYVVGSGISTELNIDVLNIIQHTNKVYTITQDSNSQNLINLDMEVTLYKDK